MNDEVLVSIMDRYSEVLKAFDKLVKDAASAKDHRGIKIFSKQYNTKTALWGAFGSTYHQLSRAKNGKQQYQTEPLTAIGSLLRILDGTYEAKSTVYVGLCAKFQKAIRGVDISRLEAELRLLEDELKQKSASGANKYKERVVTGRGAHGGEGFGQGSKPSLGEVGLDELPHLWIKTNHSVNEVKWDDVDRSEFNRISRFVEEKLRTSFDIGQIYRASNATGSNVYAVADLDGDKKIVVKEYRHSFSSDEIASLVEVQKAVAGSRIFPQGGCLVPLVEPLPTARGGGTIISYGFVRGADDRGPVDQRVEHFAGKSCAEIGDVAAKLSALNEVISKAKPRSYGDVGFRRAFDAEKWGRLRKKLEDKVAIVSRARYVAVAELDIIDRVYLNISALLGTGGGPYESSMSLNDCHPHNIFVDVATGSCQLIFDYDLRTEWPEVATVGFAMHRLCRDYVRKGLRGQARSRDESYLAWRTPELIRDSIGAFVEGYATGREKVARQLPGDGLRWAQAVNFVKLVNNIGYELMPDEYIDGAGRGEPEHFAEIVKVCFVSTGDFGDAGSGRLRVCGRVTVQSILARHSENAVDRHGVSRPAMSAAIPPCPSDWARGDEPPTRPDAGAEPCSLSRLL